MIVFNFISHILADKIGIKPVLIAASILNIIGFASMMTKTKMKLQMIKMKNLDFD